MTTQLLFSTSMRKRLDELVEKHADVVAEALLRDGFILQPNIHHITFRDGEDLVSFCPSGKEQLINDNGEWSRQGRQTMRIGKLVRTLLKPDILAMVKDNDIEKFVNRLKAHVEGESPIQFTEVSGKDIITYYNEAMYDFDDAGCRSGTLWDSCMRYDSCEKYIEFYSKNIKKISMVIAYRKNKKYVRCPYPVGDMVYIIGRAILWTLDDGTKFMDRIYSINNKTDEMFKYHAIDKGYFHKKHQSNSHGTRLINPDGYEIEKIIMVSDVNTMLFFPYLDTMNHVKRHPQGMMSNARFEFQDAYTQHQNGSYNNIEIIRSKYDDRLYERDEVTRVTHGIFANEYVPANFVARLDPTIYPSPRGYAYATLPECEQDNSTFQFYMKADAVKDSLGNWTHPTFLLKMSPAFCRERAVKVGSKVSSTFIKRHSRAILVPETGFVHTMNELVPYYDEHNLVAGKTLPKFTIEFKGRRYHKDLIPAKIKREMEIMKKQMELTFKEVGEVPDVNWLEKATNDFLDKSQAAEEAMMKRKWINEQEWMYGQQMTDSIQNAIDEQIRSADRRIARDDSFDDETF